MDQATRKEWLERRRHGLGSSDAAAVCGLDPWRTPLEVYLTKTMPEFADHDSQAKAWGRRLEDTIAQAYSEETGRPIYRPACMIEQHKTLPWMLCSLDRLTEVDGRGRIVECKNVRQDSDQWGAPGTDDIPDHYLIQCQHQLCVTGMQTCDLAVLFGGQDLRVYEVPANEEVQVKLTRILSDFWAKVQRREAPEPSWTHPSTPDLIKAIQRVTPGLAGTLHEGWVAAAVRHKELGRELSELKAERENLQAQMVHAMGLCEVAVLPSGHQITRKLIHRKGYTVDPTSYHDFRIKEPKGGECLKTTP